MTRFDFTPLFRSSVGFDHVARLLDEAGALSDAAGFPAYNIEWLGDDRYRIAIAAAGFGPEDLEVEFGNGVLTVAGKAASAHEEPSYVHRAVAGRAFKRTFHLADHMTVLGARLENGLLEIDLVRELPEEKRPRRIEIGSSAPKRIARKARELLKSFAKAA